MQLWDIEIKESVKTEVLKLGVNFRICKVIYKNINPLEVKLFWESLWSKSHISFSVWSLSSPNHLHTNSDKFWIWCSLHLVGMMRINQTRNLYHYDNWQF